MGKIVAEPETFWISTPMKKFSEIYEAGLPNIRGPKQMKIFFLESLVKLQVSEFFRKKEIDLTPDDILEVGLDKETYRSAGNAATGAIIGRALAGGAGLLAGAAIGGARRREHHLHLVIRYMGADLTIFFKPSRNTGQIYAELKLFMTKQTKKIENIVADVPHLDSAGQIEKLVALRDAGNLTQDEFEKLKQQALEFFLGTGNQTHTQIEQS